MPATQVPGGRALAVVLLTMVMLAPHPPVGLAAAQPGHVRNTTGTNQQLAQHRPLSGAEHGSSDFNGDTYSDLAIGVPNEDIGRIADAGAVHVLYGSPNPPNILASSASQFWTQNTPGVLERAEAGDRFGASLAFGDFDGDGYDDLAIGVPREDLSTRTRTIRDAGAVSVLYGSPSGLSASRDQFWTQDSRYIEDQAERGDQFGAALAAGAFYNIFITPPGLDSLVVGVPREDVGSRVDAGAVHVIYSRRNGLNGWRSVVWTQNSERMPDVAERGDHFGASLATGFFDPYGVGLAIGVPDEDLGGVKDVGAVAIMSAYPTGPIPREFWSQNTGDVLDQIEPGDRFGFSLASVSWMGSSDVDLAIGVPGEDFPGLADAGAMHVLAGDIDGGLTEYPQGFYRQSGPEQAGARFGHALAAGGTATKSYIAIGAPFADVGSAIDAGSVEVIGEPVWTQDSAGQDKAEAGDHFGSVLAGARTSGTNSAMLAIGVPDEDVGSAIDGGAVTVLYAPWSSFSATDSQFWHQNSPGIANWAEVGDRFGASVA